MGIGKNFRNFMFKMIADVLAKRLAAAAIGLATDVAIAIKEVGLATTVGIAWAMASQAKFGWVGLITAGLIGAAFGAMIASIAKFAEGGIVTKPTLGMVGEAGPEAIIPLSKMGDMGGKTELHFHVAGMFLEADPTSWEKLVRANILPVIDAFMMKSSSLRRGIA